MSGPNQRSEGAVIAGRLALSNALADLAERVKKSVQAQASAEGHAAREALAAGEMLLQARAEATHGTWLHFLERAGVDERKAQRLIRLARSGLKPDTVSDLGGVKASLRWLSGLALPRDGQALMARVGANDDAPSYGLVTPALDGHGYDVASINLSSGEVVSTRPGRPCVGDEPTVWTVFFMLMEGVAPLADLTFEVVNDDDGEWGQQVRGEGPYAEAVAA